MPRKKKPNSLIENLKTPDGASMISSDNCCHPISPAPSLNHNIQHLSESILLLQTEWRNDVQALKNSIQTATQVGDSSHLYHSNMHDKNLNSTEIISNVSHSSSNNPNISSFIEQIQAMESSYFTQLDALNNKFIAISEQLASLEYQVDELEAYSRRPCVLFHGICLQQHESAADVICNFIWDMLSIDVRPQDFVAVHQLPQNNNSERPPPIIAKFIHMSTRNSVFFAKKKLKGSDYLITENLTKRRMELYKAAKATFSNVWTYMGNIFALDSDGRKIRINCTNDIYKV